MNFTTRKNATFWASCMLLIVLFLSAGLVSCQAVEEKVEEGAEQVEGKVVTEAKKLALSQVSDGLDKLKEKMQNDEGKDADWARSEVAKIRENLKPVLDKVQQSGFTGLDWVEDELLKLEEKLSDPERVDAVATTIDEFIKDLETRLGVSE